MREQNKLNARAIIGLLGVTLLGLGLAGCDTSAAPPGETATAQEAETADAHSDTLLPLGVPISAIMAGLVNRASYEVFRSTTDAGSLSDDDWLMVGFAAVDLVGASTLITTPGTGSEDEAWTSDQLWLEASRDMQLASLDIGRAASSRDEALLADATARLAQSCQSCHIIFSPRLVTSQPALQ